MSSRCWFIRFFKMLFSAGNRNRFGRSLGCSLAVVAGTFRGELIAARDAGAVFVQQDIDAQ